MASLGFGAEKRRLRWTFLLQAILLMCISLPGCVWSQGSGETCQESDQPVLASIDPPSGTTELTYTITGEQLDRVGEITLIQGGNSLGISIEARNATEVRFTIMATSSVVEDGPATLTLVPDNSSCNTVFVDIELRERDIIFFITGGNLNVQPGTVILGDGCLPADCGDNSTTYNVTVDGFVLEAVNTTSLGLAPDAGFLVRFPNTNGPPFTAPVAIVTQYSTFPSPNVMITYRLPGTIMMVTPSNGQRGTEVTITGENLLGVGRGIALAEVELGGNLADIISSSQTEVVVRATSGVGQGSRTVILRSNQTLEVESTTSMFEGPFTSADDTWSQLEDGIITNIIPPAAQSGRTVTLCGDRLLGGGDMINSIYLANQPTSNFDSIPFPAGLGFMGSECITATVPDVEVPEDGISGNVTLIANTRAIVESSEDISFSYAEIRMVNPNRGQFGTSVTISGIELLSGYPVESVMPEVFLSGVQATVRNFNSTTIEVQVEMPPEPELGSASGMLTESSIFGVTGPVEIVITSPDVLTLPFNVSIDSAWTYERPGEILNIDPPFGQYGTRLNLTGENLLGYGTSLSNATVNGTEAMILEFSNSSVIIEAPDLGIIGFVTIVLFSNNDAQVTGTVLFEYRERGQIDNVSPSEGQHGTFVTIMGSSLFGHGDNITSVTFGGVPTIINYTDISNSSIQVRIQLINNIAETLVPVRIVADTFAIVESTGDIWTYLVQGEVRNVTPSEGQEGTRVNITGENLLGGGTSVQRVFLDGVPAILEDGGVSNTLISVEMRNLSTQIDISPGEVYIEADTGAIVNGGNYTHRSSGEIMSFSPQQGRQGTRITIVGNNLLGYGKEIIGVEINGTEGFIESFNDTVATVRAGYAAEGSQGPIRLLIDTGAVVSSAEDNVFTYEQPGMIVSVDPREGAEGSGILIRGVALRTDSTQIVYVTIGGSPVSRIVTESDTVVSVIAGPAPLTNATMAEINITANDLSFVEGMTFSYVNYTISLPGRRTGQEGTLIQIELPNDVSFTPSFNLIATIDDQEATIEDISTAGGYINVSVPRARRHGMYVADVAVESIERLVARLPDGFTYVPEGVVYLVTPRSGQRGTRIVLQGEDLLGNGSSIDSAVIQVGPDNEVPLNVSGSSNNTRVELEVLGNPQNISVFPVDGDIILTADTGAIVRRLDGFTFISPGLITSISPQEGQFGSEVTIIGTDLLQGMPVSGVTITGAGIEAMILEQDINGVPTPASDSQILVQVQRPEVGMDPPSGPVEIVLPTGARITSSDTFSYDMEGRITSVNPAIGTAGTNVEIEGSNLLGGGTSALRILLGGVEADFDPAQMINRIVIVTAQEGTPGTGDVEIISNNGDIVILEDAWTYRELGQITGIDPAIGQQGVEVTISGESLLLGSQDNVIDLCVLAGVTGVVVSCTDDSVVCRAEYSTTDIELTDLVQLRLANGPVITSNSSVNFTYYPARIDQIDPTNGSNGTFVNITGMNLFSEPSGDFNVSNVTFGGVVANVTEVISRNTIIVRVGEFSNTSLGDVVRVTSDSGAFLELQNAWDYSEPGEIESITPNSGFPGDTITINGTNLAPVVCVPDRPDVRVILGQTESYEATVVNGSITFRPGVYQGDPNRELDTPNDDIPIQVIAADGATVFTDAITFRYNATGMVASVAPMAGGNGSEVIIQGTDLLSNGSAILVTLAGVEAEIVNASESKVVVIAGLGPDDGRTGGIVIESDNGRLTGLGGDVWTYLPVVRADQVFPQRGQNGTIVTIDLSEIPDTYTLEEVFLNGVAADIVETDTNGSTTVITPASNATSNGDIVLRFVGDVILTITNAWSYLDPIELDETAPLAPEEGYFNTMVTISGSNFQAGGVQVSNVSLAGLSTELISQTDTTLQVRITQMVNSSTGDITGPVVILSENGATFTSEVEFTYVRVDVQSVEPPDGQGGTMVTIRGIGLLAGGNDIDSLFFDTMPASMFEANDTVINVQVPSSTTETNATVIRYTIDTTEAEVTITGMWRYVPSGEITAVTPALGNNGTVVTITGRGMFAGGARAQMVFLGDVAATEILVNNEILIQVRAGYSTETSEQSDNVQVSIVADTGAVTTSDKSSDVIFEYTKPGTVDSVVPDSGQNGTRVTIIGRRLQNGEEISRVWLAGVVAEIESIDEDTSTTIVVRAGRPSILGPFSGPVTIESNRGTLTYSTTPFNYIAEGLILSVVPVQGQTGTRVRIMGEGLLGGGTTLVNVTLAGVQADFEISNSMEITVVASDPCQSNATTGDIVLISDTGAYVRRIDRWTYVEPGVITSVDPPEGQFGTRVTITGERLLSGGNSISEVYIGGVAVYEIVSSVNSVVVVRAGEPSSGEAFNTTNITLVSNDGGILVSNVTWDYLEQSNITDVSPSNGTGRTNVSVSGSNLLGGGESIQRVTVADIEATNIQGNNSDIVTFETGLNQDGREITGDIVLESDTGAQTILVNGWTYDNECPVGQFGDANNCSECSSECVSCFGPEDTDCYDCENFIIMLSETAMRCVNQCPSVSNVDKVCLDSCESNQYPQIDTITGAMICRECNPLCDPANSCSGPNATQCGRCQYFYENTTLSCVEICPNGTFSDEYNNCVPCDDQCVPESSCTGPTATDCNACRNVKIETNILDINLMITGDICIANCPEAFYESDSYCLSCSEECRGCDGSTPYDCISCRNSAISYPNGTRKCVSNCNPVLTRLTMYDDVSGTCQPCSSLCSLEGGCYGPSASECYGCRNDSETLLPLPTLDGSCVNQCNISYYHDTTTGECTICNPACTNGCTGLTSGDCIVQSEEDKSEPFSAGEGTIAIAVIIIVALLIILIILVIVLVWRFTRYGQYKLPDGEEGQGDRYALSPRLTETEFTGDLKKDKTLEKTAKEASPVGAANAGFEEGELYTDMAGEEEDGKEKGPRVTVEELYTDVERGQRAAAVSLVKSEGVAGSQELYTDMESVPPEEAKPKQPTPPIPQRPPKPEGKPTQPQSQKPPEKEPPPPRPPSPEMYTEMTASVQEVYINPTADEEYSEMAPTEAVQDDFYDDAGSVRPPTALPTTKPPPTTPRHSTTEETTPLLTSAPPPASDDLDALYEDTDVAIAAAEEYKRQSTSNLQRDLPPELPQRSVPKKKTSAPLPPTPLEQSIASKNNQPAKPDDVYTDVPIEESLYEPIPGAGAHKRLLPDEPLPEPPPKRGGKGSNVVPLPPKPKPKARK